eukprot:m.190221 g.190221  ORF g.190221 m.190221 type:complete len:180 (+) comp16753_c4_seq1:985-1524(+)
MFAVFPSASYLFPLTQLCKKDVCDTSVFSFGCSGHDIVFKASVHVQHHFATSRRILTEPLVFVLSFIFSSFSSSSLPPFFSLLPSAASLVLFVAPVVLPPQDRSAMAVRKTAAPAGATKLNKMRTTKAKDPNNLSIKVVNPLAKKNTRKQQAAAAAAAQPKKLSMAQARRAVRMITTNA